MLRYYSLTLRKTALLSLLEVRIGLQGCRLKTAGRVLGLKFRNSCHLPLWQIASS